MSERWASVLGYEGLYEVSDLGRIRRIGMAAKTGKGHGGGARIGRILKPQKHRGGYRAVQLWKDGKLRNFLVHIIVAHAFLGPTPKGKEVNHDDGHKPNCAASNLEYLTRAENIKHAYRTGLRIGKPILSGEDHHLAKLSALKASEIRLRYQPRVHTLKALAGEYGVNHKTIHAIISGKTWKEVV